MPVHSLQRGRLRQRQEEEGDERSNGLTGFGKLRTPALAPGRLNQCSRNREQALQTDSENLAQTREDAVFILAAIPVQP